MISDTSIVSLFCDTVMCSAATRAWFPYGCGWSGFRSSLPSLGFRMQTES